MLRAGRSLADLAGGLVERVPQRLVNVPIPQPERLADCAEVWEAVVKAEAELGHEGRVLLRPSGTEPLVRVMVEARDEAQADAVAAQLAGVVEAALGQIEPQATQVAWVSMCGIIGVTGEADAVPLLLGALHQLEYRGYDSAGIAMVVDGDGGRHRLAGPGRRRHRLGGQAGRAGRRRPPGPRGGHRAHPLGHPRQPHRRERPPAHRLHRAPRPSSTTASSRTTPSCGPSSRPTGTRLTSATDTEVMAHLIEQEMAAGASLAEATRTMLRRVRGAFSIAVVSRRRARHHRGRPPLDAARARAARRHGPAWPRTSPR